MNAAAPRLKFRHGTAAFRQRLRVVPKAVAPECRP